MTKRSLRPFFSSGLIVLAVVGAYHLGKAYASGIPTTNPLVYTGTLLNNGAPATSPQNIGISLWTDPTSNTSQVCDVPSGAVTVDALGRFSVPLNATCLAAVGANPDVYVEVDVGGAPIGARTHLGAVPYAVEANHAQAASSAVGSLQSQVTRPAIPGPDGGPAYSLMAVFKTSTSAQYTGALSYPATSPTVFGYAAAKLICQDAVGSNTAHMCDSSEMIRSAQLGLLDAAIFGGGWISSGVIVSGSGGEPDQDCGGWTDTSLDGADWAISGSSTRPDQTLCSAPLPLLCCD